MTHRALLRWHRRLEAIALFLIGLALGANLVGVALLLH